MLRERLWERSNSSVPAGATHVYENAVPTQKYSRERRFHAFPLHYTPAGDDMHVWAPLYLASTPRVVGREKEAIPENFEVLTSKRRI